MQRGYYKDIVGGAGSLSNDKIPYCKICADNGFPHEAILFKVAEEIEKVVPFDWIVGKVIRTRKWAVFDYYSRQPHKHKFSSSTKKEVAA